MSQIDLFLALGGGWESGRTQRVEPRQTLRPLLCFEMSAGRPEQRRPFAAQGMCRSGGKPIMKNPYALGFWCALAALVLLSATYFYGIMLAHQIDKAMVFLDSAVALVATMAIVVVAWAVLQSQRLKKRQLEQSKTLVLIWDTKVALRRVETVFDRYFWGSYWQPGRTFAEVMGELSGTPLEKSLEVSEKTVPGTRQAGRRRWLALVQQRP
jgi:hypothetical protein